MKQGDALIYGCVIIGGGIGFILDRALPGVIIGLGLGYLLKYATLKDKEN
ncbi:MAG TPA: hypothetical protein VGN02_10315 [Paenibacillus sp.]|jgi:putative effector of murein hydrolase LrgA (UPF0299 family)